MSKLFPTILSKQERKALRILAAYGDVSAGEFVRQKIHEAWERRFPDIPLGQEPYGRKQKDEEK